MPDAATLVLASASPTRRRLLEQAGVAHCVEPARVDEDAVKQSLRAEGATPGQAAETLAELKAQKVSVRHPGALVIGADQMLDCDDRWFDKPADLGQAHDQLLVLAGREHRLTSAVVAVRDGTRLWHQRAEARLLMRPFDGAFVEAYLAAVGAAALESVGAYQLEGRGVQLFDRVQGDYFAILGLPLLPLLAFLRDQGAVPR